METGATVYSTVEPSDVSAQDLGDTVVLTGRADISVVSNRKQNTFGVRFTDIWQKQGDNWRMVAWQSTELL